MFKSQNREVLFAYDAADEVSLLALQQFHMKSIKSVENWSGAGSETQTTSKFAQICIPLIEDTRLRKMASDQIYCKGVDVQIFKVRSTEICIILHADLVMMTEEFIV
ncbi:unnamed protein product [Gongylonema pulchrum]|uniref:Uncharacterized protein n=1 Tax=Gongylonema pulchrum TaxID=637853 RepID=A0A183DFA5_9BILA|nr:unnamed protein product [Gongylonema pulchrum]